jgi:hypothetical protein
MLELKGVAKQVGNMNYTLCHQVRAE